MENVFIIDKNISIQSQDYSFAMENILAKPLVWKFRIKQCSVFFRVLGSLKLEICDSDEYEVLKDFLSLRTK